ncbi:MAG: ABC transporter permease [Candidatus Aminicenantes bacterium]|nr:ABC transporter permease [Candidatus Aminicenantes bacterium]
MFRNYLVTAFRGLQRNRLNTLIIVFSLGTGIACGILSFLFIRSELAFDRFHRNLPNIYEVKMVLSLPVGRAVSVPRAAAALSLAEEFPEVVRTVRMEKKRLIVRRGEKIFEEQFLAADPAFLEMFTFPLETGSSADALRGLDAIVLGEEAARKYFGEDDPVGQTLAVRLDAEFSAFVVTGVLKKIPETSSLDFDVLINLASVYGDSLSSPQRGPSLSCFVQLASRNSAGPLEDKFKTTIDVPLQKKYTKASGHALQPLSAFHLQADYGSYVLGRRSTVDYSLILAGIAFLVVLIACSNFVNLSVGRASTRNTEVGVRKVLGARTNQLVRQFWTESLTYVFVALAAGLALAESFMPAFNRVSQKSLGLDVFSDGWTPAFLAALVLLVGIAAGSYPALVLSRFSSVDLFRGRMKLSGKNAFSRSLVVFQFCVSIFLLVATVFLSKQKNYMLHSKLGYDPDQVIVLPLKSLPPDTDKSGFFVPSLKSRLLGHGMIQGVSGSSYNLSEGWMATYLDKAEGNPVIVAYNYADQDFLPTLGFELVAGRNFSLDHPSDREDAVIINRTFARMLGVDNPVGRRLSEFFPGDFDRQIIGVVEDFHSQSLHDPILPAFVGMGGMDHKFVFIKVKGDGIREAIEAVKKEFTVLAPHVPFEYSFLDEELARLYEREANWVHLVEYASIFAVLIACCGLVGLTSQIIGRRTREIGIRRVLGASVGKILVMINREFVWLVLAANILAWPAAYVAVSSILRNYAYRVAVTPWVFLASGLLVLLVAVLTVSANAIQAARANPSRVLKHE